VVRLILTGGSLTRRPKRYLRCILFEVPWQINEYLNLLIVYLRKQVFIVVSIRFNKYRTPCIDKKLTLRRWSWLNLVSSWFIGIIHNTQKQKNKILYLYCNLGFDNFFPSSILLKKDKSPLFSSFTDCGAATKTCS